MAEVNVRRRGTVNPEPRKGMYEYPAPGYEEDKNKKVVVTYSSINGNGFGGYGETVFGTEGTLVINDEGCQILREPRKDSLEPQKFKSGPDPRPAHVRNLLDCVKSRQQPVENLEVGHHISTVAHLGNIALRSGRKIVWDHARQEIVNDPEANRLVSVKYREPWKLPYLEDRA